MANQDTQAQQLRIMLELQDRVNTRVHPQWREQKFEFYRAIWVEGVELMDHYGWKWWKKQSPVAERAALGQIHVGAFARLMAGVPMDLDSLYRGYVGKNVLNFFRQDHGYQEGTYRKSWHDGREDNEHLVELVHSLDASRISFQEDLYKALKTRYQI